MAQITIPDLNENDFMNVKTHNDNYDVIENEINGNLDNSNLDASAGIDPSKIANGGAVTQNEVTTTGESSKIPKLDSNGDIKIGRRIVFLEGTI